MLASAAWIGHSTRPPLAEASFYSIRCVSAACQLSSEFLKDYRDLISCDSLLPSFGIPSKRSNAYKLVLALCLSADDQISPGPTRYLAYPSIIRLRHPQDVDLSSANSGVHVFRIEKGGSLHLMRPLQRISKIIG
jgi:hypothetical protein